MDHLEAPASSMLPPPQRKETVRYSKEEWDRHRPIVEGMYPLKGMHLKGIIAFLKEDRGFIVNERQLKRKIKDWKLEKKVKGDEMKAIVRKMQERVGKNTSFRVRGQTVEPAKIERWQKRSGTLNAIATSALSPDSPAPSTPSDISYNTVQGIRSPSPHQHNIDSFSGLNSEFEENVPPSPFSPQSDSGHLHSPQDAFAMEIATILAENGNFFEGQSPAPFTAPPSPAPSQKYDVHGASSDPAQYMDLDDNIGSSGDASHAPFRTSAATLARPQPIKATQKKRYRQKEELELAERLNDIQSKYGPDHAATIDTASRLGQIFMDQGRYRSAERLYKQTAEGLHKIFGENHPRTLMEFANLSQAFTMQNQFSKAKTLIQLLHTRASKVFHPSHEIVLCIKNDLANCIYSMGNSLDAEQLFREIMVLGGAALSPDHSVMLFAMRNLGELLLDQGKILEAEKLLVVLYETSVLSGSLRDQLWNRSLLGTIWHLKGESQKAEEVLREVLAAQKQLVGPEHRETLFTQKLLIQAVQKLGRFAEAEELARDTISKAVKTLGGRHSLTLDNELDLAELLLILQRYREVEEVAEKVLKISEEAYGLEFRVTCRAASILGSSHYHQGHLNEAFSTTEKAFKGCLRRLGPEDRVTRTHEHRLIMLTQQIEQLQKSQDGVSMRMNPPHQISAEGFGLSSNDLDGISQLLEDHVGY